MYQDDIDDVIKRSIAHGVKKFIIPGADPKDLPKAVELSENYSEVFFAVGVHPYDCENFNLDTLTQYVTHPKCIAVGECGLDYFRLPEDEDEKTQNIQLQKKVFQTQVEFALKYQKPLIVHIRDASNDSRTILEKYDTQQIGGVLHCFNASEHLLPLSKGNFYFGIGGVVTFKNAKKLVDILPKIPLERMILETDGPYLTPHPHRGTRNDPSYTTLIAKKISEILNLEYDEICNITTANSKKLFKI